MKDLRSSACPMTFLSPSATLAITAKAKALKAAGENVCPMGAGEPDFDTPAHIKQAAIDALLRGETKYTPASGIPALKEAVAAKFTHENGIATDASRIVISPGAKFSDYAAVCALCGPGDEVILPAPYWVSYPEMIKSCGAAAVILPCRAENQYEPVPEELEQLVTERTKLLILNTPSNPTGAVYRASVIDQIAEIALRRHFMVLSDEIYEKLVYDHEYRHKSIGSLSPDMNELTVTVNGLSKSYAMTGWRLGYLTGPEWLTGRIAAYQSHTTSNPTTFAQYGALAALTGPQDTVETMRQAFGRRRDLICNLFSAIPGIKFTRPRGAFYLFFDIAAFGMEAMEFATRLLDEEKVAAVPGNAFGAPSCIRVSYACSEEVIREAAARIKRFCAKLKGA